MLKMSKVAEAEPLTFTVNLSFSAHEIAQECRRQQPHPRKGKQVYLNSLAVYAVEYYLRCMGWESNWESSDSRNSLMLKFLDVADLDVKQLGKLECRPVLQNAEVMHIPADVWSDRVAYVAVRLSQSLREATVLGFVRSPAREVPLSKLRSPEEMLLYMSEISQAEPVNLRQWFDKQFESGWQTLSELLSSEQMDFALGYRPLEITRGREIDLGLQLEGKSVALVVSLLSGADEMEVDMRVQVHPAKDEIYLPSGLKLIVIDESGEEVLETFSRDADNFIQLEFNAEEGEQFAVAMTLGEAKVTQDFQL